MQSAAADNSDTMVGSFRRMNQIGKGSFATVYKGVHIVRASPAPALPRTAPLNNARPL